MFSLPILTCLTGLLNTKITIASCLRAVCIQNLSIDKKIIIEIVTHPIIV